MIALPQRAAHVQSRLAAVIALLAAVPGITPALSAAPQVRTQPPGYYRMMLGDFEITALSDGTVVLPVNKLLTNITAAKVDKALRASTSQTRWKPRSTATSSTPAASWC